MDKFGYHDICASIFVPLLCDGTIDPDNEPIAYCGTSSVALRKTVNAATEQEGPNTSGTTGRRCLYRRVPSTPGDCFLDITTCGIEDPALWAQIGLEAPIYDDAGELCGYEEPLVEESKCVSCGKESATCRHSMAFVTLHNKWCGEDQRSLDAPYMARKHGSLLLELVEQTETFGQGFTHFRELSFQLQRNPLFVDPWQIDTRTGVNTKYSAHKVQCPDGSPIEAIIDQACACGVCDGDLTIGEANQLANLAAA